MKMFKYRDYGTKSRKISQSLSKIGWASQKIRKYVENDENDLIWPRKWPWGQILREDSKSPLKVSYYPKVWAKSVKRYGDL